MNTAYGIFKYEFNHFCAYLAYQTGTNFSYVRQKKQITYIDNYLKGLTKGFKLCFVYENEYTDKNYMVDFSTYYVNCFSSYKKTTSRIHFFKYTEEKDLKNEFKLALNSKDSLFKSENYLGFIVIRPIAKTFLARVCLLPFKINNDRLIKYYLTKQYDVSLFGIQLSIKSIAFQEQDKILSACATTSLWSFYHAHKNLCHDMVPSSGEITKSAYPELNGHSREFPNKGLSTDMISRSLRKQNLSPEYFEFKVKKQERLQEIIFAYCSSGIPIILGVSVTDDKGTSKGLHAITVVGYSLDCTKSSTLISHSLNKIYAHDDRYGPYIKMILDGDRFKVQLDENEITKIVDKNEIYEVDTLILGLYHKIRIPYIPIKNTCLALCDNLKDFVINLNRDNFSDEVENFSKMMNDIKWDISIIENSQLKRDLLNKNIKNKESHLTKALPKYIWNAKAIIGDFVLFQLLFDATDIEQSDVFIDYISYNSEICDQILDFLKKYSKEQSEINIHNVDSLDTKEEDNYLNGLLNYFNKQKTYVDSLDEVFGYLKTPLLIKAEEIIDDVINDSKIFRDNFSNNSGFILNPKLPNNSQYIWLIDKDGFLCVGIEKSKNGHPTLTNGMPARIGGEIKPILKSDGKYTWKINSKSGRYSSDYDIEDQKKYLNNAVVYKFKLIFPSENFELEEH